MLPTSVYPYLNLNDLNLDYILNAIREMRYEVTNFVSINAIKYANPIQWNITRQYEKNTIVIDPVTGTAYISVAPVPAGVALTRPEYWTVVFDLGLFITRAARNFTNHWESETTTTATFNSSMGDWLIWGDVLYKALVNITAGDAYVIGSNIEHFTIEDLYNSYLNTIASILAMIGDLVDLTTDDKTSVVYAINSVVSNIGALTDLETSDKTSIVNAINELSGVDEILKANRKFSALRVGSYAVDVSVGVGQTVVVVGNEYWDFGDLGSSDFYLTRIDKSTMAVIGSVTYNYNCHPNGAFVFNGLIYVVDSRNHQIFIINPDMTINTIFSPGFSCISGNVDENGNAYVGNAAEIYLMATDNTFTKVCDLESLPEPTSIINQGFVVNDNKILYVKNRPNIITVHDMNGVCLGNINIGIGNGFYPYGEVESFFYDNGELYMLTAPYNAASDRKLWLEEIFLTNIIHPIVNNSMYGQAFPTNERLHVDNTAASKNGDGTSTHPFNTLYEAGCVLNYLATLYPYSFGIVIDNAADYSNDELLISDVVCSFEAYSANYSIGILRITNCKMIIADAKIGYLNATYSDIVFNKCTIVNLYTNRSKLAFGKTTIGDSTTTNANINASYITGDFDWNCAASFGSENVVVPYYYKDLYTEFSAGWKIDPLVDYLIGAGWHSKISLTLSIAVSGVLYSGVGVLSIARVPKATYAGGGTITKRCLATFTKTDGTLCYMAFDVALDGGTDSATFTIVKCADVSGNSITPTAVYIDGVEVVNCLMNYTNEGR